MGLFETSKNSGKWSTETGNVLDKQKKFLMNNFWNVQLEASVSIKSQVNNVNIHSCKGENPKKFATQTIWKKNGSMWTRLATRCIGQTISNEATSARRQPWAVITWRYSLITEILSNRFFTKNWLLNVLFFLHNVIRIIFVTAKVLYLKKRLKLNFEKFFHMRCSRFVVILIPHIMVTLSCLFVRSLMLRALMTRRRYSVLVGNL